MKWVLATMVALLIISLAFLKPISIHQGYQVLWKEEVCEEALSVVRSKGYRLLLNDASLTQEPRSEVRVELTEECDSDSIAYCLIIPGTNPLKFLKVEKG